MIQYRDPLIGVLDYIVEVSQPEHAAYNVLSGPQKKCIEDAVDEDTIAIVHDDDLRLIDWGGVVSSSQN